eukprot:4203-Chlamydomonas_euryale.AAC.1
MAGPRPSSQSPSRALAHVSKHTDVGVGQRLALPAGPPIDPPASAPPPSMLLTDATRAESDADSTPPASAALPGAADPGPENVTPVRSG